ncbi:hypothetical protein HELRODRAFT_179162 [Helobdella robusta]|uniref:Uncharacterized protein n=1 Tax=Helobdella robusta TaxID=6412 RepID=T1FEA5_HELRO|nr:hypothetical protein HELRODRAFT_179162 [Helobdella robusta]ESN95691.1 hypothetical protein HELRODRAFT_179162 [Helobdella robusta]
MTTGKQQQKVSDQSLQTVAQNAASQCPSSYDVISISSSSSSSSSLPSSMPASSYGKLWYSFGANTNLNVEWAMRELYLNASNIMSYQVFVEHIQQKQQFKGVDGDPLALVTSCFQSSPLLERFLYSDRLNLKRIAC